MKNNFILTLFCLYLTNCFGQIGEIGQYDCNYSKQIIIPFNYSENGTFLKPLLNQTVFYNYRDQFSFWYKISVKKDEKLNFQISAIDSNDSYVVGVYQYNDLDFCNKLYNQKIKPLSKLLYVGSTGGTQIETALNSIEVFDGNVYYISILNISLNNCGHYFKLTYGSDTLNVKALHLPCKKDIATISVTQKSVINLAENFAKDTLQKNIPVASSILNDSVKILTPLLEPSTIKNNITCMVKDGNNFKLINAVLTIIDLEYQETIPLTNQSIGHWNAQLDMHRKHKIHCAYFGYTDLEMNLDTLTGEVMELLLYPLKVGQTMVMKSIYFHPNTYALKIDSSEELKKLLIYLMNNSDVNIEIRGHTNSDNKISKNKLHRNLGEDWNFQGSAKKLSLKRAEVIKLYLVSNGIASERLVPKGYGGSKAIIANPKTIDESQKNIRVEIVILKD